MVTFGNCGKWASWICIFWSMAMVLRILNLFTQSQDLVLSHHGTHVVTRNLYGTEVILSEFYEEVTKKGCFLTDPPSLMARRPRSARAELHVLGKVIYFPTLMRRMFTVRKPSVLYSCVHSSGPLKCLYCLGPTDILKSPRIHSLIQGHQAPIQRQLQTASMQQWLLCDLAEMAGFFTRNTCHICMTVNMTEQQFPGRVM